MTRGIVAHKEFGEEDSLYVASSSSEEEEEEDVEEEVEALVEEDGPEEEEPASELSPKAVKGTNATKQPAAVRLKISLKDDVCKVCGKRGHKAGFVGATYVDCPNRPCYLCKQVGHTTATCPFRIAPGHGCTAAATRGSTGSPGGHSLFAALQSRECDGSRHQVAPQRPRVPRYQVDAAILKLHKRRCCTLEFHPSHDGIVVSGDKKGALAVWNFDQVHERTVYPTVHSCLANSVRFLPWLDAMAAVTVSSDGTAKLVDLETGDWRPLLDLNPGGWVQGSPWYMIYGCDASPSLGSVIVGDSNGCVHLLDPRTRGSVACLQLHRRNTKITSVHMHPLYPPLVLTAGNDHSVRLFDIRELSSSPSASAAAVAAAAAGSGSAAAPPLPRSPAAAAAAAASVGSGLLSPQGDGASGGGASGGGAAKEGKGSKGGKGGGGKAGGAGGGKKGVGAAAQAELAVMMHPRVVNAAYFSPHTGRRLLTTCQDNRLRVWDYAPHDCGGPPDREIVHSHDFSRHLTPFKAEWDPKDPTEEVMVVGRYISEDFGGIALHPVDVLSAADGSLLAQLTDTHLPTIPTVNKPHPRRDLIVSGSSGSLYLWAPMPKQEEEEDEAEARQRDGKVAGRSQGGQATDTGTGPSGMARSSRTFVSFDVDAAEGKKRKKAPVKG